MRGGQAAALLHQLSATAPASARESLGPSVRQLTGTLLATAPSLTLTELCTALSALRALLVTSLDVLVPLAHRLLGLCQHAPGLVASGVQQACAALVDMRTLVPSDVDNASVGAPAHVSTAHRTSRQGRLACSITADSPGTEQGAFMRRAPHASAAQLGQVPPDAAVQPPSANAHCQGAAGPSADASQTSKAWGQGTALAAQAVAYALRQRAAMATFRNPREELTDLCQQVCFAPTLQAPGTAPVMQHVFMRCFWPQHSSSASDCVAE
jgi:hypothetical protein